MSVVIPITIAYGDGIGPEIMEAVLFILKEARAQIKIETIKIGKELYEKGYSSGISDGAWESIKRTKLLLKAPITTPQGGGYKSLNVTLRKTLGLYANVRPAFSMYPFIETKFPDLDLVVVRENEEDLYAGIEYRQTASTYQSLKLISKPGSQRIIKYAFEYAVRNNRKKVTCISKDNIMKFTDGIFHKVFDEIAASYPKIETNHYILDIGTARIATSPEEFDVIVTSNLYGDVISDVAAELCGSVGMSGSANLGTDYAMFEAIHGSAPTMAGKNIANPSGLLNAAVMMLVHIGQSEVATKIDNAWRKTIEDGIHTADIYSEKFSKRKVATDEFAKEVVKRLGSVPSKLKLVSYKNKDTKKQSIDYKIDTKEKKELVGIDIFIDMLTDNPQLIADKIKKIKVKGLKLETISSKGLKLWPGENKFYADHWCLRFLKTGKTLNSKMIPELLLELSKAKIDYIKTENLYYFDNVAGYSLAQGE